MTRIMGTKLMDDVHYEIVRQDAHHPAGYPATRDGVRLGLATCEDELREALDAWRDDRCKCPTPMCGHADWDTVRAEVTQVVAVALRLLRSIHAMPVRQP